MTVVLRLDGFIGVAAFKITHDPVHVPSKSRCAY